MGLRAVLKDLEKRKIRCPYRDSNSEPANRIGVVTIPTDMIRYLFTTIGFPADGSGLAPMS